MGKIVTRMKIIKHLLQFKEKYKDGIKQDKNSLTKNTRRSCFFNLYYASNM